MSAALSRTLLDEGDTSIAFSLRARPFMQSDSAAWSQEVSTKQKKVCEMTNLFV